MSTPPGLVLASVVSPAEQTIFSEVVQRGLDRTQLDTADPPGDDRMVHGYPVPAADHIDGRAIEAGDYVLFYTGANQYTDAAQVLDVTHNSEVATSATKQALRQAGASLDTSDHTIGTLLWIDVPIPIELQSFQLHDALDIGDEALTRTRVCGPETTSGLVDEYGSIESMLTTARVEPDVYIEVTSLEDKPYKQPGGDLELGTAVFSRSEASNGADIYSTLRDPNLGDIVLHVLKDTRELRGISRVASTLQTDFEGPPDDSWDANARGNGYFLPLANYRAFENPLDIDGDLLQNSDYQGEFERIYDTHDGLFYDKNFELAQGAYFTAVPTPLRYVLIAEAPAIVDHAREWWWTIEAPSPAESYDSVSGAVVDIRTRLPFTQYNRGWFQTAMTEKLVEQFTDSLKSVQPEAKLTLREVHHCEMLQAIYTDYANTFDQAARELGVGDINQARPGEVLFFVLFRELQSAVGLSANMNHVKAKTILEENYSVKTPERELSATPEGEPLASSNPPDQASDIARQLQDSGQMVFYGPPGTGKTYTAKQFAHWWLNEQPGVDPHTGQFETVTFHPSFTYEDFVEGLSVGTDEEGVVTYDEEAGVFLEFAEHARQDYYASEEGEEAPRYILLIDEINRGNLAQIFGELITALEADKRLAGANETAISLAHSGDRFTIPPNLYLIGTMNTADRSIALVDAALRRRFTFLSFPPRLRLLREEYDLGSWADVATTARTAGADDQLLAQSIIAVHQLNSRIRSEPDLGRGKQIGHSYFFDIETEQDIVDIWQFEVLPLVEEYFFGQYGRIQDVLFGRGGSEVFDWERQQIRAFDKTQLAAALEPFVEEFDAASVGAEE
ncbi:AAA domain-containing protein [Halorubellus sp. JP-L1]|uniref:McrB family protein n=1 Tax=Halorubellus sp. JP-L1 TaxID=2715753 RepID=UPI00140B8ACC|nr:AAA family ATPase [Halorubellus sp. JP-L1]NHN41820.1 AAA domain-containing protein [Halorubellus sp. JP-L1]